jgi:hypothetical protein
MVDLSIVVDDLGNFGCSQNCSTSLIESLLAHAHIQVWLVAPNPPLTLGKSLKTTPVAGFPNFNLHLDTYWNISH